VEGVEKRALMRIAAWQVQHRSSAYASFISRLTSSAVARPFYKRHMFSRSKAKSVTST
jgi:hypothetical protein